MPPATIPVSGTAADNTASGTRWFRLPRWFPIFGQPHDADDQGSPEVESPDRQWDPTLDALLWSGYTETGDPASVLRAIDSVQEAELQRIRSGNRAHLAELQAEIDALLEQRRQEPREVAGLRVTLYELVAAEHKLADALDDARTNVLGQYARLAMKRPEYGLRMLKDRAAAEADLAEAAGASVARAEGARLQSELDLLSGEIVRRALVAPEIEEQVTAKRERAGEVKANLQKHLSLLDAARRSGLTPRVAGFLVWAGYLGLAAFGWMLGEALYAQWTGERDGTGLVGFLAEAAYRTFLRLSLEASFWWVTGFAILTMVVGPAMLWVYDWILTRFDRKWNPAAAELPTERAGRRGRGKRETAESDARRSGELSWGSVLRTLQGETERSDYRRHLARAPMISLPIITGLLALIFFARAKAIDVTNLRVPVDGVVFLIVGIATAAVMTGICSTVFRRWIAPSSIETAPHQKHWVTVLLCVGSIVFFGWTVAANVSSVVRGPWAHSGLSGSIVLVALNAWVLAYGLVYGSLQRDCKSLAAELGRIEREIVDIQPATFVDINDLKPTGLFDRWSDLNQRIEEVWAGQDAATAGVLAGEADAAQFASDPVLAATQLTVLDGRMEPGVAGAVQDARLTYLTARRRLRRTRSRKEDVLNRLGEIASGTLAARIESLRQAQEHSHNETVTALAEVNARFAQLRLDAAVAHRTGVTLRERERTIRADLYLRPIPGAHHG